MKRLHPDRQIVCIAGDGDFLMNGQEFATAVQYGLPFIVVIADNGIYGTIRMHQEREYPGRSSPPICVIPTLRPTLARSAASACRLSEPPIFRRRSKKRRLPASPRSCASPSIRKRSRR